MGTPFSGLKKFEDFFYNTKSIKKIPNNQISKVSQAPQALFTMTAPFDKKQQLVISLYEGENDYQQLIISYKSHTKSFVGKEIGSQPSDAQKC